MNDNTWSITEGLSLRDWFAGMAISGAMSAMIIAGSMVDIANIKVDLDKCAEDAYRLADAMIRAREKKPE